MKRRILNSKANRPLSRRGARVGKDGHFVGALIGLAGSVAGHFIGKDKAKKDAAAADALEKESLLAQGQEMQNQQDIMDSQHSQEVLASYNPQGSAQMYARDGARMYAEGGGFPSLDKPPTTDDDLRSWKHRGLMRRGTDFLSRNNIVGPEKLQFLTDLAGGEDTITENTLSPEQLEVLKVAVNNAKAAGRNYVDYKDYPGEEDAGIYWKKKDEKKGADKVFGTDDSVALKRLLGKFSFEEDENGEVMISDQYNFNKEASDPTSLSETYDKMTDKDATGFGRIRAVGEYLGSNEGEGSKSRIKLDNLTTTPSDSTFTTVNESNATKSRALGAAAPKNSESIKLSPKGDSYEYKYNPDTDTYHTKKKSGKNWVSVKSGTKAHTAISGLFPKQEDPAPIQEAAPEEQYTPESWFDTASPQEQSQLKNDLGYMPNGKNGMKAYNPTTMYNRGGLGYQGGGEAPIGLHEGVRTEKGYSENQYTPNYLGLDKNTALGRSYMGLNEAQSNVIRRQQKQKHPGTGKMMTHGEVADWMTTDDAVDYYRRQPTGTLDQARAQQTADANKRIQRLATMGGNELPPQYNQDYVNQTIVTDEETLGTSYGNFEDRLHATKYDDKGEVYQMGGRNMYDELQDTNMQEYQSYQGGGAAQVPGGKIEQETQRGQIVNGDNPEVIDDVELGTNPGEPQAMVDHGEVLVDAVDENGQPYKQIFSDTVLVPGKNISMAKEAKKLLKQVPKDEESEQAQHVYAKLDALFETQQMLNGDSQGEDPQEAAAGGMDPNAAQQMGQEGTQAFQVGGSIAALNVGKGLGWVDRKMNENDARLASEEQIIEYDPQGEPYPEGTSGYQVLKDHASDKWSKFKKSAGIGNGPIPFLPSGYDSPEKPSKQYGGSEYYNEGMREEMMQVPYPKKKGLFMGGDAFADLGGGGGGWGAAIDGVTKGLSAGMKGYGTGYGMGMSDTGAGKAGYGMMAAQNMLGDIGGATGGIQNTLSERRAGKEEERANAMADQSAIGQGTGYQNMAQPGGMMQTNIQGFQNGGEYYEEEPMGIHDMYAEAKSFVDYFEQGYKMPNTLADMQASANAKNWGHLSTENGLRRNSNLMGRLHRGSSLDPSPVTSPSERGGPTPAKRKGYVMGGRLYASTLNRKSLTLSIA